MNQPDRLTAAARRALAALDDLISNTFDPGVEALGARHELSTALIAASLPAVPADEETHVRRTLTPDEYDAAWHAVEGAAGELGADPGTVLGAVLDRLGIQPPTA